MTISSTALVAGTLNGVTVASGVYRFPSLVPGTYTARVELQGFQSVVRENLAVVVGQTIQVELTLKVASVAETVTVTGASPTVDTTSANVNVNLSQELLQSTPGVGGTSGGLQGTYSARGTATTQNSQYLNGVNVGDSAAIGAAGFYHDYDAFEDIQVSTGAHDITVPTSGVFLNMVTKSGGNRWAGRAFGAYLPHGLQSKNIDADLLKFGFRDDTNSVDYTSDATFNVPAAFSTNVLDQTNITSGLGDLTYQVNSKNKLTAFYTWQNYDSPTERFRERYQGNATAAVLRGQLPRRASRGEVRLRPRACTGAGEDPPRR